MDCYQCGKVLPENSLFCSNCGSKQDKTACIKCGKFIEKESIFCVYCGVQQAAAQKEAGYTPEEQSFRPNTAFFPAYKPVKKKRDKAFFSAIYNIVGASLALLFFVFSLMPLGSFDIGQAIPDASVSENFDGVKINYNLFDLYGVAFTAMSNVSAEEILSDAMHYLEENLDERTMEDLDDGRSLTARQKRVVSAAFSKSGIIRIFGASELQGLNLTILIKITLAALTATAAAIVALVMLIIYACRLFGPELSIHRLMVAECALGLSLAVLASLIGNGSGAANILLIVFSVLGIAFVLVYRILLLKKPVNSRRIIKSGVVFGCCGIILLTLLAPVLNFTYSFDSHWSGMELSSRARDSEALNSFFVITDIAAYEDEFPFFDSEEIASNLEHLSPSERRTYLSIINSVIIFSEMLNESGSAAIVFSIMPYLMLCAAALIIAIAATSLGWLVSDKEDAAITIPVLLFIAVVLTNAILIVFFRFTLHDAFTSVEITLTAFPFICSLLSLGLLIFCGVFGLEKSTPENAKLPYFPV